jgi:membrane-associated phospholipid phosphatase
MAKKWPFIPVFVLAITGIILGSFYDLAISNALYQAQNGFGLFMAAFGELPCYAGLGLVGGCLLKVELKNDKVLWRKIVAIAIGALVAIFGAVLASKAIISRNAYNIESWWYLGYPIGFFIVGMAYLGGYFFAKKIDDPHALRDLLSILAVMATALIITTVVKNLNPRPRYRWLVGEVSGSFPSSLDYFHNFWESASSLKSQVLAIDKGFSEEFKSFPSGHVTSGTMAILLLGYIPRLDTKLMKHQILFFFIGLVYVLVLMYSRILIGAHFLTDVSFGLLITTTCFFVMDMILYHQKKEKIA